MVSANFFVQMQGSYRQLSALPHDGDFFWEKSPTPILDMVETPIHLKNLSTQVFDVHEYTMFKFSFHNVLVFVGSVM